MIALLLLVVLADKPYAVTWEVNHGGAIPNQVRTKRFASEFEAQLVSLRAPRCKPPENKTPCVVWVRIDVVKATSALRAMNANP